MSRPNNPIHAAQNDALASNSTMNQNGNLPGANQTTLMFANSKVSNDKASTKNLQGQSNLRFVNQNNNTASSFFEANPQPNQGLM